VRAEKAIGGFQRPVRSRKRGSRSPCKVGRALTLRTLNVSRLKRLVGVPGLFPCHFVWDSAHACNESTRPPRQVVERRTKHPAAGFKTGQAFGN
jgi:hypothetical protein